MLAFGYEECGQYDKAKQSAQEVYNYLCTLFDRLIGT
jgi:hypothetical protein